MSVFDDVGSKIDGLQYMSRDRAEFMRDFISSRGIASILEIGFFKGKSTAYFAAILEDLGRGHVTTIDKVGALKRSPNIHEVLGMTGLSDRVTPVLAERSHTWELSKMIREDPRPRFDFCYFDGGHTWDVTGFGFVLVDMLLKPGGWIVFDDLDWTIDKSLKSAPQREKAYRGYGEDERASPGVRMVFEILVPAFGYVSIDEVERFSWGIAQKPVERTS